MTGDFLDIRDRTAVGSLVGEGVTQCRTDGMGGEVLDVSSEVEEIFFERIIFEERFFEERFFEE